MEENTKHSRAVAAAPARRSCFLIGPIGPEKSDIRKRADQVEKYIVKAVLDDLYDVERAEQISNPGMIIAQVVERVCDADLVVADLAGLNANVFYELGIRHSLGKPAIHIAPNDVTLPFDVNQLRCILYNLSDLDSIEEAKRHLKEQVGAVQRGVKLTTPVQFAENMRSLKGSGDTRDTQVVQLLSAFNQGIENIRDIVSRIELYTQPQMGTLSFQAPAGPAGALGRVELGTLVPGGVRSVELLRNAVRYAPRAKAEAEDKETDTNSKED